MEISFCPRLEGDYQHWDYVYKPRGIEWLYKRPRVRGRDFTYWYRGVEPIHCNGARVSDGFTLPFTVRMASFGALDFVMPKILWVARLHDESCRQKMQTSPGFVYHGSYGARRLRAVNLHTCGLEDWGPNGADNTTHYQYALLTSTVYRKI